MKILRLLMLLLLPLAARAATVSGLTSFAPSWYSHQSSWGLKVYLADSSTATGMIVYRDSTTADQAGSYSFNIPASLSSGLFRTYVYSPACGTVTATAYQAYSGTSITMPGIVVHCGGPYVWDTVRNAVNGQPVSGQLVYLVDSTASFYFKDSAYTMSNGMVDFAIPPIITSGTLRIYTNSCGLQSQTVSYTGSFLIAPTMLICDSNVMITGTLTDAATGTPIRYTQVFIADSAGGSQLFADSTWTDGSGHYSFPVPPAVTSGTLTVSAQGCGLRHTITASFSGTNTTLNLVSCTTTVSGTIYTRNGVRNGPIVPAAGATVIVYQGLCMPCAPIITTASATGTYSIVIPPTWTTGTLVNLWDSAASGPCPGLHFGPQITWTGGSVVMNDTLCNWPWYVVGGRVSLQGSGAVANAKVWLIHDTVYTAGTHILTAVDSTLTNASGDYRFLSALWYPGGSFHVKAALPASHPNYGSYLPTYGDSSLLWSAAATFSGAAWLSCDSSRNIALLGGVNPGGPGFIGGSVLLGANKSSGAGDPLPARIVTLTTAAGNAVAFTYSDAAGTFGFSNLPTGNYLLFGDAWGKTNPALGISLTATAPSVNNVVFEETGTEFKGRLNTVGVAGNPAFGEVRLSPNPADDELRIRGLSQIAGSKHLVLRDPAGRVAHTYELDAGCDITLPASGLSAGVYFLEVRAAGGTASYRFVKR